MNKYCVYITTNVKNGIKYIGSSTTDRVFDGYMGSGTLLGMAMREHGKEAFEVKIVSRHGTRLSAFKAESALIGKLSKKSDLYNISSNQHQKLTIEDSCWTPTRKPKTISINFRMDSELMELIDDIAMERGHTRTRVVLDFIKLGLDAVKRESNEYIEKPEDVYDRKADEEVHKNNVAHQRIFDELTKDDSSGSQEAFHLAHGNITFSEIVEKHKAELDKKYK